MLNMKRFVFSTVQLLLGACYLLDGIHVNAATTPKCNADNCLRAMFPTNSPAQLSSASAFCATYTSGIHTVTIGFPTRASAACGSNPSRFSSVCNCQPKPTTRVTTITITSPTATTPTTTVAPTTTVTVSSSPETCEDSGFIQNGGFECGLRPWAPQATPGTVYSITSPGYNSLFAFEVDQISVADTSTGREQASINQNVTLRAGETYMLSFQSYFNRGDAGFIGVMIDHRPAYTVDAQDKNGPLVWNSNSFLFGDITGSGITNIRFEFLFGAAGSIDKIDQVSLVAQPTAS